MGRNRFVQPESVRLPLSDGDWIDVKRELTAGEQRQMFGRMVRGYSPEDGRAELDPEKVGRTKLTAYLLGWSFKEPFSDDAIDALNVATYKELVEAIDAHEAAVEAEYAKNSTDGESKSAAISPSAA